jgi:two-component system, sensor histidine kinase and response regulator
MPSSSEQRQSAAAATVSAGNGELPILDHEIMLGTVERDLELLRELVEIFLAESPGLLAQIRTGIAERNLELAERGAHTLKGAVGNFGGRRAAEAARAVEEVAREHRLDRVQALLPALEAEISQVCRALSEYLREVGP